MLAAANNSGLRSWIPLPAGGYALPVDGGSFATMTRTGKGQIFLNVAGESFDLGKRATFTHAETKLSSLGLS